MSEDSIISLKNEDRKENFWPKRESCCDGKKRLKIHLKKRAGVNWNETEDRNLVDIMF